ncbi:hypothetical protein J6590_016743 [Homalodisca vitripennis]|nr:hypothetical protein J6590_016743 [Homalodisca vitripennis]
MDHVVDLTQYVEDTFHRKLSTFAVLVGLKSAYEIVWRRMLLHKMSQAGIAEKLFHWEKSFLRERHQRVK